MTKLGAKFLGLGSAAVFACMLGVGAANADVLYTNGPANTQSDAWTINYGFAVADSFKLTSASTLTGVDLTLWAYTAGDTLTSVDWVILSGEPGTGSVLDSGTASVTNAVLGVNGVGYTILGDSFSLPSVVLSSGTYWIELLNASVPNGDPIYWDMNGGPSSAWESGSGDVTDCTDSGLNAPPLGNNRCSTTFDITGTSSGAVPEPLTLSLFGGGLAGAAAMRRRRRANKAA
jgi:PEP-CTERM motif